MIQNFRTSFNHRLKKIFNLFTIREPKSRYSWPTPYIQMRRFSAITVVKLLNFKCFYGKNKKKNVIIQTFSSAIWESLWFWQTGIRFKNQNQKKSAIWASAIQIRQSGNQQFGIRQLGMLSCHTRIFWGRAGNIYHFLGKYFRMFASTFLSNVMIYHKPTSTFISIIVRVV